MLLIQRADAADGFLDEISIAINRRLLGFSKMVNSLSAMPR